jgi:hypothetical protein
MRQGLLVAGTERGVYVSFDDGDSWESLQLNLPVTSMRDFQIYDNDLIVATHGRGFWLIDDISALRQMNDDVLRSDAHLFKPADVIYLAPGSDNGTPVQKDEPEAENPPNGAIIDYYLRVAARGTTKLEIVDASGALVGVFTNDPANVNADAARGRGGIPNTTIHWRPTPERFATGAGIHRVVWTPVAGGGGRGRGGRGSAARLTGTFTARLTVNGQAQTQTFTVRPDPRLPTER